MRRPKFVVADTMDLWLNIALPDLLKLLKRVDGFVLNESEAQQLTQENNLIRAAKKIHRLGPEYVIIKKGEHGAILSARGKLFVAPAFPLAHVEDPTGAGDSFRRRHDGIFVGGAGPVETIFGGRFCMAASWRPTAAKASA